MAWRRLGTWRDFDSKTRWLGFSTKTCLEKIFSSVTKSVTLNSTQTLYQKFFFVFTQARSPGVVRRLSVYIFEDTQSLYQAFIPNNLTDNTLLCGDEMNTIQNAAKTRVALLNLFRLLTPSLGPKIFSTLAITELSTCQIY